MAENQTNATATDPLSLYRAYIKTEPQDDTNQLVAYRMRVGGRASYNWVVSFRGKHLVTISKRDSKWVHDNWDHDFHDMADVTKANRPYVNQLMRDLTFKIRDAITARQAECVNAPR